MSMAARAASAVFASGWARISRRRRRRAPIQSIPSSIQDQAVPSSSHSHTQQQPVEKGAISRGMDILRASIRRSLRRRRRSRDRPLNVTNGGSPIETPPPPPPSTRNQSGNGGNKNQLWQPDEAAVRSGTCAFNVKYLGGVEVFESRGMQVCEGALKLLRSQRRRPVRAMLYVSGDGLRVVDGENNRGLIVDQTIEKVSFCAPDRNHDKGFAYICRDGTSRRWMCHGFHAIKETGERLSHAVGCAFAVCLERKKKRDTESNLSISSEPMNPPSVSTTNVTNGLSRGVEQYNSFRRQLSIGERIQDPQTAIVLPSMPPLMINKMNKIPIQTIAKARPAPNPALFERQGSLRAPEPVAGAFRRQYSLRPEVISRNIEPVLLNSFNEPIYEGDESPQMNSSKPSPSAFSSFSNTAVTFTPQHNSYSPLIHCDNISHTGSEQSARSKADEWLEQTLRNSLSISSNVVDCGPPPIQPPPPLPPVAVLASPSRTVYEAFANVDAQPGTIGMDIQPSAVRMDGQLGAVRMDGQLNTVRMDGQLNTVRMDFQPSAVRMDGQLGTVRMDGQLDSVRMDVQPGAVRMDGQLNTVRMDGQLNTVRMDGQLSTVRMDGQPGTIGMDVQPGNVRMDVFGLPEFNPATSKDPFEVQWTSLGNGSSTNPFAKESAQVSI